MSFSDKFSSHGVNAGIASDIKRKNALVYAFWTSQPEGRKGYFVLDVDPPKHDAFKRLMDAGEIFALTDYGTILYSGWEEPDDDTKAVLRKKYGLYTE